MPVTRGGADAFLSAEARAYLETTQPGRFPGVAVTAETMAFIRKLSDDAGRARLDGLLASRRVTFKDAARGGVSVVEAVAAEPEATPRRILYLHGGAFVMGAAGDAGAVLLADLFRVPVTSVAYRLAPEHPFPAGLEDCLTVYRDLAASMDARDIVVVGMSAGAALAAGMLLRARAEGLAMPRAAILLTPGADCAAIGDSLDANDGRDPVLTWTDQLDKALAVYVGDADPAHPELSPSRADYRGVWPPTLIVTGTRDVLLSPCVRLYWRMRRDGAPVDLRVFDGMWHGFMFAETLPEAAACLADIRAFADAA